MGNNDSPLPSNLTLLIYISPPGLETYFQVLFIASYQLRGTSLPADCWVSHPKFTRPRKDERILIRCIDYVHTIFSVGILFCTAEIAELVEDTARNLIFLIPALRLLYPCPQPHDPSLYPHFH